MKLKKILSMILCVFLATGLLAGCGSADVGGDEVSPSASVNGTDGSSPSAGPQDEQPAKQLEMLRMAEGGNEFPTPWLRSKKGGGSRKHMLIFDSLLEKDNEGLVPWLAKSYEIEDDGVTYVFKLRDNILWHDGEKMTSDDVVFSFEYFTDFTPVSSSLDFEDIASVEAVDELTVKIVSKEVCATLLENIGKVSIIPKHVWENVEDPTTYEEPDALIGSGPYLLVERNASESVMVYEANENFWGPAPAAKTLYWMNAADDVLSLEAGETDLARKVSAEQAEQFRQGDEFTVQYGPAFSGSRLVFNFDASELLAQKEIRQAIYYAMDSQEMIDKLASGVGEVSNPGVLPPAHIMYNPDVRQYNHSLDEAGALLDALGYSVIGEDGIRVNENGDRLSFELLASTADSAKLFVEQMARAGIEFVVTLAESATAEQKVADSEFEAAIVGHAGLGGDADYLRERYAGGDLGASTTELATKGYDNADVISLLEEQRTLINFEERKAMLFEIQELMAEDVVEIMLYYGYDVTAWRPDVWDGWMYCYDERNFLGCKMSYLLYDQWEDA